MASGSLKVTDSAGTHVSSAQVEVNNDVNLCVHARETSMHANTNNARIMKGREGRKHRWKQESRVAKCLGLMGQDESAHQLTAGRLRND